MITAALLLCAIPAVQSAPAAPTDPGLVYTPWDDLDGDGHPDVFTADFSFTAQGSPPNRNSWGYPAFLFLIRGSQAPIDSEASWAGADYFFPDEWFDGRAFETETVEWHYGFTPGATYYVAVRSKDSAGNLSAIVSIGATTPSATVPQALPPSAPLHFGGTVSSNSVLSVLWTAGGADGRIGEADHYDLRGSYAPIETSDDWDHADSFGNVAAPVPSGGHQHCLLPVATTVGQFYYIGIRAVDAGGLASPTARAVIFNHPIPVDEKKDKALCAASSGGTNFFALSVLALALLRRSAR